MSNPTAMRDAVRAKLSAMVDRVNRILESAATVWPNDDESWRGRCTAWDPEGPEWPETVPITDRREIQVAVTVCRGVHAEERGDRAAQREVLDWLATYLESEGVSLRVRHHDGWEEMRTDPEAIDTDSAFTYLLYAAVHRPLLGARLGSCRQCGTLYLKPLHGADSLYESKACSQKAYRKRKQDEDRPS